MEEFSGFSIESPNATSGSTVDLIGLDVVYTMSRITFRINANFAKELAQGVALSSATTGYATVPITVYAQSGGGVSFSSLSVSTSPGYTTSINKLAIRLVSIQTEKFMKSSQHMKSLRLLAHSKKLTLIFESATGMIELSYSD